MTAAAAPDGPLFPQMLLDALRADPDRPAFEHGARVVSCRDLLSMVGTLAAAMRAAGLGPGHGVALMTSVTPEAFAANLAAHALGCRVAGVRPGWSTPQLAGVLAGLDAVVGDPVTLTPAVLAATGPASVLSLGARAGAVDLLGVSGDAGPVDVVARPDDIARLNFTSGSTGRPKGCARTYRTFSLDYVPDRWAPQLGRLVGHLGRLLVYGSFSMPVMFTFAGRSLLTGGTVVLGGGDAAPDLAGAIERHGISGLAMTPPRLHDILISLRDDPRDLVSLRAVVVSGSPASPALLAAAADRLGPVVWQGYGQAESGMISLLSPDDIARHPGTALTSVGRILPDVEIRVRDRDGRALDPGEPGDIWVRSPRMMACYWDDERQTREVLDHGWLNTRDIGWLDRNGFAQLNGRSRDVIMVNGEVCYAGAIEAVLAGHPDVGQAYAVGVPDERTGEAVHAFVVPAGDQRPGLEDLAARVRAELTPAHIPATISVVTSVPVAAGGKPDKRALVRSLHSTDIDRTRPKPTSP